MSPVLVRFPIELSRHPALNLPHEHRCETRIAQLNIMDAIFMAVAQKNYSSAEENLSRTMSAVKTKRRE